MGQQRSATLASVARAARVSRQTVSNVLNAPDLVHSSTRRRVEAVIAEQGYRPNRAAQSLRTQASRLLGYAVRPRPALVISSVLDRFLHALTANAEDSGHHVLLFAERPGRSEIDGYAELLARNAVDGFVLSDTDVDDPRPGWLDRRGVPFVAFGRDWSRPDDGHWVDVDGAAGTRAAVEHLYALGHRRIAYLGWPEGSGVGDDRRAGYLGACAELGVRPVAVAIEDGYETGHGATSQLLDRGRQAPTAFVCVSDGMAMGCLQTLRGRGLRPGHDAGVVGFDDSPLAGLPGVELTSVQQPVETVGEAVVARLLRRLAEPDAPAEPLLLAPRLAVRASTDPAGSAAGSSDPRPLPGGSPA
jgi:DNA-binding LacI/PurR family transcriptional regulator